MQTLTPCKPLPMQSLTHAKTSIHATLDPCNPQSMQPLICATLDPCNPRSVQPSIRASPCARRRGEGALPALLALQGIALPSLAGEGRRGANGSLRRPGSLPEPSTGAPARRILGLILQRCCSRKSTPGQIRIRLRWWIKLNSFSFRASISNEQFISHGQFCHLKLQS